MTVIHSHHLLGLRDVWVQWLKAVFRPHLVPIAVKHGSHLCESNNKNTTHYAVIFMLIKGVTLMECKVFGVFLAPSKNKIHIHSLVLSQKGLRRLNKVGWGIE